MRKKSEIAEYMDEAFDIVWLVRSHHTTSHPEGIPEDIMKGCLDSIKRICDKYEIDYEEPVSDWDYGYWSGILAALRWVMGDEKDFLDT
jgi:hypothetical protein